MKICSTCEIEKELSQFYKDERRLDKRQSRCISCELEAKKVFWENNQERIRHRRKELMLLKVFARN